MKLNKNLGIFLLAAVTAFAGTKTVSHAEYQYRENIKVVVDGEEKCDIMALEDSYANNNYISLRGLAYALDGTDKQFKPEVSSSEIYISTGKGFDEEPCVWEDDEKEDHSKITLIKNDLEVDGKERKYYSLIGSISDGEKDAFFAPLTLAMMLNLDLSMDGNEIKINTQNDYNLTCMDMENSGYLQGINSLVVGDATTGEIYYSFCGDTPFPIASTTKLMTYLCVMEAVDAGEISINDKATVPKEAAVISRTSDGVIVMDEGDTASISDFLAALLIKSSNECAITLATHVAGSEEAFVERMNKKAEELGLIDTKFYNSNGLPVYKDQVVPAKIQNHMTGKEMFVLSSEIVDKYPQVMDITSIKEGTIASFNQEIKNTNAVLYNIDEVKGLKTGTTKRSGACLVTCAPVEKDGETHNLVSVLFGAENEIGRAEASEMAMRYAMKELEGTAVNTEKAAEEIPSNPELVIQKLIRNMEKAD